jgi:hypothetical protein
VLSPFVCARRNSDPLAEDFLLVNNESQSQTDDDIQMKLRPLIALPLLFATSCVTLTPRSRPTTASATVIPNVPRQRWGVESCGAGSLSTVLQHYGDHVTLAELDRTMPKMRGGVLSLDMLIEARKRGFTAQMVKGDPATVTEWVRAGKPVILMLQVVDYPGKHFDFFHYVVVDGYDPQAGLVRIQFGKGSPRWTTFPRIEDSWKGGGHAAILVEQKAADSGPRPVEALLRQAVTMETKGKAADAIPLYREILASSPSALAWTNLGNAQLTSGDAAAAASSFRRAIEIDPNYRDALNNLAWLLLQQHQLPESESLARRALAQGGPDLDLVHDTLGHILAEEGKCDEALNAFRSGAAAVPATRVPARAALELALGNEQLKCGHEAEARASFNEALSHQPDADTAEAIRKALGPANR